MIIQKNFLYFFSMVLFYANTYGEMHFFLEKYKTFLEKGTYDGQDWSHLSKKPLSRYHTFKKALSLFSNNKGNTIVELGTTRSFVHGGLPGCNSDDPKYWTPEKPERWDWGAGCFTRIVGEFLQSYQDICVFHTIDCNPDHIKRCKIITSEFSNLINYHICYSTTFLLQCSQQSIDLLYLDTGDMTPLEPTAKMQLEEAKIIVEKNLIKIKGLILIDDVRNQAPRMLGENAELGKAKYSLPYLLENGFSIIMNEYQVLLQKD